MIAHRATDTDGLAAGKAARDAAHALLSARRELYVLRGRRALLSALLCMETATADDVRDAVELPDGIDPVCLGAVAGPLARAKIIERAGYAATCRPQAHARPITVWRLIDRAAALTWLAEHPDRRTTATMPRRRTICRYGARRKRRGVGGATRRPPRTSSTFHRGFKQWENYRTFFAPVTRTGYATPGSKPKRLRILGRCRRASTSPGSSPGN